MGIVMVKFVVGPPHVEAFYQAMQQQGRNSLARETDGHQFDAVRGGLQA